MSTSKMDTNPDLPAPLSLTLDEAREVAGGLSLSLGDMVAKWWWYGQPANPWVLNAAAQPVQSVNVGGLSNAGLVINNG
jgi:hypothetical protein